MTTAESPDYPPPVGESQAVRWVVGYGRTKHLPHPTLARPSLREWARMGLCGAFGAFPSTRGEKRPTCKHCLRIEAASDRGTE